MKVSNSECVAIDISLSHFFVTLIKDFATGLSKEVLGASWQYRVPAPQRLVFGEYPLYLCTFVEEIKPRGESLIFPTLVVESIGDFGNRFFCFSDNNSIQSWATCQQLSIQLFISSEMRTTSKN
jgi:hypothetical protein